MQMEKLFSVVYVCVSVLECVREREIESGSRKYMHGHALVFCIFYRDYTVHYTG